MSNPFQKMLPALELIIKQAKVLPATGQAMQDMTRPDHNEVIDTLRLGDDKTMDVLLETPNRKPYVEVTLIHRTENHLFRYFLDGSAHTYFLGDAVEGKRNTSVHVSQIGAACVHRTDDGKVHVAKSIHRTILLLDKNAVSFGDDVEKLMKQAGAGFEFHDTMMKDGESERTSPGKEPRSRAPHKAHHLMSELEDELGRGLKRKKDEWFILDGSLSKDLYKWDKVKEFLGVTKSFSREPRFKIPGARGGRIVNLYELLAELPFSARTCAFSARSGKVAVWYVRIREQKHMDYPLMGVLKIELPNPGTEPVSSDLINEISGALVAERQVSPHGSDKRWHAHLYSIYLAEQAVKNGFVSYEVLKAGLKWPILIGNRTT